MRTLKFLGWVGFVVYAVREATRDEILKGMRPRALRRGNGGTR